MTPLVPGSFDMSESIDMILGSIFLFLFYLFFGTVLSFAVQDIMRKTYSPRARAIFILFWPVVIAYGILLFVLYRIPCALIRNKWD